MELLQHWSLYWLKSSSIIFIYLNKLNIKLIRHLHVFILSVCISPCLSSLSFRFNTDIAAMKHQNTVEKHSPASSHYRRRRKSLQTDRWTLVQKTAGSFREGERDGGRGETMTLAILREREREESQWDRCEAKRSSVCH